MTADTLRAAIEAALRRRDPAADVSSGDAPNGFSGRDASAIVMHGYAASRGESDDEALSRLATLVGLRVTDDGVTDPAEECERLRAELARVTAERDALRAAAREYRDASIAAQAAMDEIGRLVADRGSVDELMAASRRGAAASARAYAALRALVEAPAGESGGSR